MSVGSRHQTMRDETDDERAAASDERESPDDEPDGERAETSRGTDDEQVSADDTGNRSTVEGEFEGRVTQKAFLFGPDGSLLVTKADDHWAVPGGKFEYGETMVGGLRRELREELSVDARVGSVVGVSHGPWLTKELTPLVTLFYHARTDDREVTLNDEHDDSEWVSVETAVERIRESFGTRAVRVLARAATLERLADSEAGPIPETVSDVEPFRPRSDPFDGCEIDSEEWVTYTTDAHELPPEEIRKRYG